MPNYYNPYNFYPASYLQTAYPNMNPGYSQTTVPMQQNSPEMLAMKWVEGEVGAKAFQMPPGWPANSPIPLWDSTDTVIYLKSWGPMGIPNPMQKLRYEMPEQQNTQLLMNGQSGAAQDTSQFVTKSDLEQMKQELKSMMSQNNQNRNREVQNNNRGGDRNG